MFWWELMAWLVPFVLFNERNEEMKRVTGILAAASLFVSAFASFAFAQEPAPQAGIMVRQERIFQGPDGPPPPPARDFVFIASENFGGKIVKNAPYSADSVTEMVQTLADGNRIVNKITSRMYRDSEGRTRRELTLKDLGPIGSSEESLQSIFISDPVASVSYSLDTRTHTAHKSVPFKFEFGDKPVLQGQHFEFKTGPGATASTSVIVAAPVGPPGQPGTRVAPAPEATEFRLRTTEAAASYELRTKTGPEGNEVKEQLGKQIIEGVEAEGTRTTRTIPAGEIGNDRLIEIVTERWYSPELQLLVMSRHSDPRSGETIYKLTNVNRSEPAKSLFEVPAGFTVKEMQMGPMAFPPARVKKLANPE
jgi:hypothetical protein